MEKQLVQLHNQEVAGKICLRVSGSKGPHRFRVHLT